jgi:hypothetical protein
MDRRARSPDPLAATDRLLIDGSNLLHALARGRAGGAGDIDRPPGLDALPATAVIGRLRSAVPAQVGIELVLDGTPDRGMQGSRIASGLIVRHAGRRSADALLLRLVDEARAASGDAANAVDNILVVTDDRQLREQLHRRGARTAGTHWLIGRLDRRRLDAPGTGNRAAPRPQSGSRQSAAPAGHGTGDGTGDGDERAGWNPGRGATEKRGNPRRAPRRTTSGNPWQTRRRPSA